MSLVAFVGFTGLAACGDDERDHGRPDASPDAGQGAGRDAGRDADIDGALSCDDGWHAFDTYVMQHSSCSGDADCTVIGDCGPNADFRAVRTDVAEQAYEMMQARCTTAWDGPIFVARCESGMCVLEEDPSGCCGCPPTEDAGVDAGL
jgi:hypothetical protein